MRLRGGIQGGGLSAEEIKISSVPEAGMGFLPEAQATCLRVLDRATLRAGNMVTRNDVVSISAARPDEVLAAMIEQQHSRLPVYEGNHERIFGVIHYKDSDGVAGATGLHAWRAAARPFQVSR